MKESSPIVEVGDITQVKTLLSTIGIENPSQAFIETLMTPESEESDCIDKQTYKFKYPRQLLIVKSAELQRVNNACKGINSKKFLQEVFNRLFSGTT